MPGQRGQESAPFELLIAVIIMTFVIVVGLEATNVLAEQKCKGEIEQNLEQMKTALENVVTQKGKANLFFDIPNCFEGEGQTSVRIKGWKDSAICGRFCGGARDSCTLVSYSSPRFVLTKCLRISHNTTFGTGSTCDRGELGSDKDNWEARDLKDDAGILQGNYTFISRFDLTGSYPIVCAYKRKLV